MILSWQIALDTWFVVSFCSGSLNVLASAAVSANVFNSDLQFFKIMALQHFLFDSMVLDSKCRDFRICLATMPSRVLRSIFLYFLQMTRNSQSPIT